MKQHLLMGLAGIALCSFPVAIQSGDVFEDILQPAFAAKCIQCHGQDGEVKGKVNLLEIESMDDLLADPELLSDIVAVIDYEEMPPEDEPQFTEEKRGEMVAMLDGLLNASMEKKKVYAQAPIRRMNRFQYNNAVIDLFDLKCIVFTLPERMMRVHQDYFQPETGVMAEQVHVGNRPLGKSQMIEPRLVGVAAYPQDLRAEHGFDVQADHLSLSPLLMEQFLKLSQSITQSRDFNPKYVGIWDEFFKAPPGKEDAKLAVKERLEPFLTKAFRRPADPEVLKRYLGYAELQLENGIDFTEVMKGLAAAAIASPKFLYLYDESSGDGEIESLSGYELASRLSFFLWGSIPDEDLLELTDSGELTEPEVLKTQVERMLKDRKLKRFCDSFPSQWLQLDRIISAIPDPKKYPEFYFSKYRDSMHMAMEPLLLFETVLIENQPITQLIDPDFTYWSKTLMKAYETEWPEGVNGPTDNKGKAVGENRPTVLTFKRVPLADRRFGGVITNAAVMTMTSGPERTQPITRGAWLATAIFNNPPAPPPADVPPLDEDEKPGEEHLTLRERLAAHRERSDCKGCHEQIDPLGFALENYDAIGVWREEYENGREVDMEGTLFRRHDFTDVVEFKDAILAEKDRFTKAFAGHLLSFALARELGAADEIAVEKIAEAVANEDYRLQTVIHEVVLSEPFRSKSNPKTNLSLADSD
ncbi:MAG: DUF1592 domain-containing protein [Verrucomicrobiota bacterium]